MFPVEVRVGQYKPSPQATPTVSRPELQSAAILSTMSELKTTAKQGLRVTHELRPATPLWKRVPLRDEDGQRLNDFMMLIPGLGRRPAARLESTLAELQAVLGHYGDFVVFADLNLKLNLLWISLKPAPGIGLELAAAVKQRVPEAMLVANKARTRQIM